MEGRLAPMIFSADLTVRCSLFLSCLVADPKQTVMDVQRTDDGGVELDQQLLRQVELPQLAQEVHPLLGFFVDGVDVGGPLLILGDCGSQKPEGLHNRHSASDLLTGGGWHRKLGEVGL